MTQVRLGMLTPSSNTVVEPVTADIVRPLPVTAHFARLPVTEISLTPAALAQFEPQPFLTAAALLADARPQVIAWNGTSAAWKGFDQDASLCAAVNERFGVPATASMLAVNAVLDATGVRRVGLITPYRDDVQAKIIANYTAAGYHITAERHSGIAENFAFAEIAPADIAAMARATAAADPRPQALLIVCTNLHSAQLVAGLEQELGLPVYDSLSAVVWHALRLAGVGTAAAGDWGSLFRQPPF